jgi:glutamate-1-semialdehyde 2,1-aminomutase
MHEALQKEIALYEKRTPKSAEAHKKAQKRIPLGVASNYRAYDPYPIFVAEGHGGKIKDIDGNEYLDHNLCFGTLMAGHGHPAVVKAVKWALDNGSTFGMPHGMELELAEEICARYPVEMVRFGNSGTEATMHACRIARAATGRDKILRFEGAYHGLHDTVLVSVKPKEEDFGDINAPNSVPGGLGVIQAVLDNVTVATFNNLGSVENRFKQFPGQIAAIILEPILMNVGLCLPQKGFLEGLRDLCTNNGALLIFDEVKTGAKLGWNGASGYFGVQPDMITLAKSIGGVWRQSRGDGPDRAAQGISRRDIQHKPAGDGRGTRDVPGSFDAGKLCACGQTRRQAGGRLPDDNQEGRTRGVCRTCRSERRADALSEGDSELPRLVED